MRIPPRVDFSDDHRDCRLAICFQNISLHLVRLFYHISDFLGLELQIFECWKQLFCEQISSPNS